jgi:transcriptional regulator with XRE-family HTH domain
MTVHEISNRVGANIRSARKRHGWTVAHLAERCTEFGRPELTQSVLENIEHGRRRNGERTRDITVDELILLSRVLDVSPRELLPELWYLVIMPPAGRAEGGPGLSARALLDQLHTDVELIERHMQERGITMKGDGTMNAG